MNILIVEDDDSIRMSLSYYLKSEGYKVIEVASCNEFYNLKENYDLVLLDVNLGDGNGFDLFNKIKDKSNVPVIFLTANDSETSIVMGLDMGASDYVTKPFRAKELVSRIKKALNQNSNQIIQIHHLTIDTFQGKVLIKEKEVFLTSLEYKLLLTMVSNRNKLFTREEILGQIWDVDSAFVNDNTLTVYIKRLREKIELDPKNPIIIKTVRGMGYKIE